MSRMLASLSMSIWDQSLIASLIEQKITPAWTIAVENGNNVPNTSSHFNIHKRKAALKLHLRSSETRISCFLWSLWLDYIDDWIIHYTYNYVYIYICICICLELHPRPLAIPSGRLCRCSHCQRRHPPPRWPSAAGHAREVPVPSIGL